MNEPARLSVDAASKSLCEATVVDCRDGKVAVLIERKSCSHCSRGCSMRLLEGSDQKTLMLSQEHFTVPITDSMAGTRLQVSFSSEMLVGLSFVVYLVPVMGMLSFVISSKIVLPDSDGVVAAALGLASGLLGARALVRILEVRAKNSLVCDPVEAPVEAKAH